MSSLQMAYLTPYPAYVFGTACIGRGVMAILTPRAEYGVVGLPLELGPVAKTVTESDEHAGTVSPLMAFKGFREISYGAALILLQLQGSEAAVTTLAGILGLVRLGDGLVVLIKGRRLRYKALGHWITAGIMFTWAFKRHQLADMLPLMADLRKAGFNPPFSY